MRNHHYVRKVITPKIDASDFGSVSPPLNKDKRESSRAVAVGKLF